MGQFVTYGPGNAATHRFRRGSLLDEDLGLPIGDTTPIFHGARGKIWNGEQIALDERIGNMK